MLIVEKWLPVLGFEGRYEVSDLGRVKSLIRKSPRILAGKISKNRRRVILLYDGHGGRHYRFAYTLVLEAFIGPRPEGLVACHWDGNSLNDNADNLRWDTLLANSDDSRRHGTLRGAHAGVEHHGVKLSEEMVRLIKNTPKETVNNAVMAQIVGISREQVRDIRLGKYWRHVA